MNSLQIKIWDLLQSAPDGLTARDVFAGVDEFGAMSERDGICRASDTLRGMSEKNYICRERRNKTPTDGALYLYKIPARDRITPPEIEREANVITDAAAYFEKDPQLIAGLRAEIETLRAELAALRESVTLAPTTWNIMQASHGDFNAFQSLKEAIDAATDLAAADCSPWMVFTECGTIVPQFVYEVAP